MSSEPTCGYYIYYRVQPDSAERAREVVLALQRELEQQTGIPGRLLRRRDDPGTWMEIYENVRDPAAFERALTQAVSLREFSRFLAPGSARITEIFEPL